MPVSAPIPAPRPIRSGLALAVVLAALIPMGAAAQEKPAPAGRVAGTVMDTKGKALPGATVTITDATSGVRRTATTDKKGAYRFDPVPVGRYTVTAELADFVTATRPAAVAANAPDVALRFFLSASSVVAPPPARAPRPVITPFD